MKKKIALIVFFIAFGLLSEFAFGSWATNPKTFTKTMETLDEKRTTVLELTAAATASSIALAAVPDDSTTPIASEIMDMTGYFVIILCTIVIEKYLLTITGFLTFKILIPVACALLIIWTLTNLRFLQRIAARLLVFGIAIFIVVPASVKATQIIENTYDVSINTTIEAAKDVESDIKEETTEANQSLEENESQNTGIFSIIDNAKDVVNDVKNGISDKVSEVTSLSEKVIQKAEDMLNDFIETVVVMLVTSCLIPIVVLLFFLWLSKNILLMDFDLGKTLDRKKHHKTPKLLEKEAEN